MCRFVKDSNDWYYDKKLSLRDKKLSLRVEGKCWKKKKKYWYCNTHTCMSK